MKVWLAEDSSSLYLLCVNSPHSRMTKAPVLVGHLRNGCFWFTAASVFFDKVWEYAGRLDSSDIDLINEYKDQVRILKQEVAELQDAGKSKDSANKRCLQKLEHSQQDLIDANKKITELEDELKKLKDTK